MKMTMYPHCLHTSTINELIIFLRIIILYFRIILRKRNSIPSTPLYRYHSATVSAWSFHPVLPGLILIPTVYIYLPFLLSAFTLNFSYACRSSEVRSDSDEITCISSLLYFAKDLSISCFSSNG
jgi:hypothetical protein